MSLVVSLPYNPVDGSHSRTFIDVISLMVVDDGIFLHTVDDDFIFVPSFDVCFLKVYF